MNSEDKLHPKSVGSSKIEPKSFPNEEEICRRLDEFYASSGVKQELPPSKIFRGALFAMRREYGENNPDWMSQTAHSLREIIYDLDSKGVKRKLALEQYGSTYDKDPEGQEVGTYYGLFTCIAHHNYERASTSSLLGGSKEKPVEITRDTFENIVYQFGRILFSVLRRQLDAHKEIDKLIDQGIDKLDNIETLKALVTLNTDSRRYFFHKAEEEWIDLLWENGFLDEIKDKAEDITRYSYEIVELGYLEGIAEKVPAKVTNIILNEDVATTENNFNPEVIDRFVRISSKLPAKYLSDIIKKIERQGWVRLMGDFAQWGFEYSQIFKNLLDIKDYESLLILAKALLAVREKKDFERRKELFYSENPFYFRDLGYTNIFKYLQEIKGKFLETALGITTISMAKTILLGEKSEEDKVFPIREYFPLFDIDYFNLQPTRQEHLSERDNVRELAAIIIFFTKKIFQIHSNQKSYTQELFSKYIDSLPDCQSMWRLRLFIVSLGPNIFSDLLKKYFLRLFIASDDGMSFQELLYGTEYKKSLHITFGFLDNQFRHNYVEKVFTLFGAPYENLMDEKRKKRDGWQILSSIYEHLTESQSNECEKLFGRKCDPAYTPLPMIGQPISGFVTPEAPITQSDFSNLSVFEIITKLKDEWSPAKLIKHEKSKDFFKPINSEGVGELLGIDINERFPDYIRNACLFFERDLLDKHYTYSYLKGVKELIKSNKFHAEEINWEELIKPILKIKDSGEKDPFNQKQSTINGNADWNANWTNVCFVIAELLEELLLDHNGNSIIEFPLFRDQLFGIIQFLLKYPDPKPMDEELETATITEQSFSDKTNLVSDPFTMAINSVRGQAFKAFLNFIYQDEKKFVDEKTLQISKDVKNVYEYVLEKEKTRSLMFMFGYYLPFFFIRDREWINTLLPKIFPKDQINKHMCLAAWEGYLSTNLYFEIFTDLEIIELYKQGLGFSSIDDPNRKFFTDPEEGIARHIALAFIFYTENFGFESELFQEFWNTNNKKKFEFIKFIGRGIISSENSKVINDLENDPHCKERIIELWDWILQEDNNSDLYADFGFWIDIEKNIFSLNKLAENVKRTLKKSNGKLNWEIGLSRSINKFAEILPEDTLEILRLFILEGKVRDSNNNKSFYSIDEWIDVFKILYNNVNTKKETETLIDSLIREGGNKFWKLKEILK